MKSPPIIDEGHRLLDGTLRTLLAQSLIAPVGIIIVTFLTRRLGPEGYGKYALAVSLILWITWAVTSLFSQATIKFVSQREDWQPIATALLRLYLATSLGAAILLWLAAPIIARTLDDSQLTTSLRILVLYIPITGLATAQRNVLIGIGAFRQRAYLTAGRLIARVSLTVALVEMGLSTAGALLGYVSASLVEFVIGRVFIPFPLIARRTVQLPRLWEYIAPLFLAAIGLRTAFKLDLFALKLLGGTPAQAGVYGAAQNLAMSFNILVTAVAPLLLSTLNRAMRDGKKEMAKQVANQTMRMIIRLLPIASLVAGVALEIAILIFGPGYEGAATPLALLIFGSLARAMILVGIAVLITVERPGVALALTGSLVPLTVVGHLIFIPRLALVGAALVTFLVMLLGALLSMVVTYIVWRTYPPIRTMLRAIVVSAAAYFLVGLWPTPNLLLLLKLAISCLAILILFYLFGEFDASEVAFVRSILRREPPLAADAGPSSQ